MPTPTDTATATSPPSVIATSVSTATDTAIPPPATAISVPPTRPPATIPPAKPTPTPSPTPTPTAAPPQVVFDPNNFYSSRNPDLTLDVFGTVTTDKNTMHLVVEGNVSTPWKITAIDSSLTANPDHGTANPGDTVFTLTASNVQNLGPGNYFVPITFYPINPNPLEEKPTKVPFNVHPLPTVTPSHASSAGGDKITMTGENLEMITGISLGSNQASLSLVNGVITLTVPPANQAGAVSISVTVKRHDGSTTSFDLPNQFTYDPVQPTPTPTQSGTPTTANVPGREYLL
ncbi:MAG TPA: IPT/TIG domain-containing protein [Ktedonosporobacter sp.]|nr:IPT/TIG domain-containing protein [Ktedonosporobacter sp.]